MNSGGALVKCENCQQTVSAQQLLDIARARADALEVQIERLQQQVALEQERAKLLQDEWFAWRATAMQDYTPERANLERDQYATLRTMLAEVC
jgi:hypothetical protein